MKYVFEKERKELQGLAAATIRIVAEFGRACEIAIEEAEKSVAALRFFTLANFSPYLKSYCTLLGREHVTRTTEILVEAGEIKQQHAGALVRGLPTWMLGNEEVAEIRAGGLGVLDDLLKRKTRTSFENDLLYAFLIYSRNSLAEDPSDKLVYILTAVESLLLSDSSEPIQANLADRIAFLVGRTTEERLSIKKTVKDTYSLRSSLLHHGNTIDDLETLETFMRYIWAMFCGLILNAKNISTKAQLIADLEKRKME
jgi:hypothetical protein